MSKTNTLEYLLPGGRQRWFRYLFAINLAAAEEKFGMANNYPDYFQDPHPVKTGNPWGMKNMNDVAQDKWEYTEGHYYTDAGIEKRAQDFAKAVEASLKSRGLYQDPKIWLENKIKKTEEEIELYEAIQAEYLASKRVYEAGDGTRWEDL